MPPRATTEALIRLRQAEEQEAMRALRRAEEGVERADVARAQALAEKAALSHRARRLTAPGARSAGALRRRDAYRAQLRSQLEQAQERVAATVRSLREATRLLDQAQRSVEQALRGREAAEAQRESQDKNEARRRERRDQAASDDRWRPPRR